jgi:hypothetical protein
VHFLGDWIVSSSLAVAKETGHRIVVHVVAVAVAVPVGFVAVARWGSAGAALSMLVASTMTLIGMLVVSARAYPLKYGLPRLLPASAVVIACAIVASAQVDVATKLFLLSASAAMWSLGLIQVHEVKYGDG